MHLNIGLILLITYHLISPSHMQQWTGTFAWNNQCKPNYCCCYSGTLTVTASGSNLRFTSGTTGCGSSQTSFSYRRPDGYSFSTTGSRGSPITFQLSSDANTLSVRNSKYSSCDGSARRTSAGIRKDGSIIYLLFISTISWILL